MTMAAIEPSPSIWLLDHEAPGPEARAAAQARPASRSIPSQWLTDLWADASSTARQARWQAFADEAGDHAAEKGFTEADRMFLFTRAFTAEGSPASSAAATFALGRIGEDRPDERRDIAHCLVFVLQHSHPRLRLAATEAIWQARAVETLPLVHEALSREADPSVRATMEHVLRVLR